MIQLFPFVDYWWFYLTFVVFVVSVLLIDLGVFHRQSHEIGVKEASLWTAFWIGLALIFNIFLYSYTLDKFNPEIAKQTATEFLTGFVIEKTLAIDNIFIFILLFSYFQIPAKYQHRVLFFGILGAVLFRAIFIALGSVLMEYKIVVILFGIFLIATGLKMFFASEKQLDIESNIVIKMLKKMVPLTPKIHGDKFFIKEKGIWMATPLLVSLIFLEATDVIFAVDSVPAIFALTKEPLIVFTSNIFAILGLRSMYFMLAGVADKFHLLKYGLAGVLIFVGLKMSWLNEHFGGKFPIGISLGIIALLIGTSIIASWLIPKKHNPTKKEAY